MSEITLTSSAAAGTTSIQVSSKTGLAIGDTIYISNSKLGDFVKITTFGATSIDFTPALTNTYSTGSIVVRSCNTFDRLGKPPYNVVPTDCILFHSAKEYLQNKMSNYRTMGQTSKKRYVSESDRISKDYQVMQPYKFVMKGTPIKKYRLTALRNTSSKNECLQRIPSSINSVRLWGGHISRGSIDKIRYN